MAGLPRYQAGPNSFLFRNRSAARIRGVELEARAALPHAFVLSVTAQSSRGRDEDDDTPLDDYYSSAGPRWVDAPGRHGAVTVVVEF